MGVNENDQGADAAARRAAAEAAGAAEEQGLLYVRGAVPGGRNAYVAVCRAKRG